MGQAREPVTGQINSSNVEVGPAHVLLFVLLHLDLHSVWITFGHDHR
jgi:hypothetical protein